MLQQFILAYLVSEELLTLLLIERNIPQCGEVVVENSLSCEDLLAEPDVRKVKQIII